MSFSKLTNKFKKNKMLLTYIVITIILIFIIYFMYYKKHFTYYKKNKNDSYELNLNTNKIIENFYSINNTQHGNVIYHFSDDINTISENPTISQSRTDNGKTGDKKEDYLVYTIELGKKYKLTDMYINITSTSTPTSTNKNIKIGCFNSSNSELYYIDLVPSNDDMEMKITETITNSKTIYNIKDIYNNDIYCNQLIIYIYGNVDESIFDTDGQPKIADITFTVCGISSDENINKNQMEYLVDKSTSIDTDSISILSNATINTFSDLTNNLDTYKITYLDFSNYLTNTSKILDIIYINKFTEEVMVYKSDRSDGKFIVTIQFPNILIYDNILLASRIELISGSTTLSSDINVKGYKANVSDINQFKLENNLTDIRGSINPNDVCPSIDDMIQGQLNAETIIDAMDNQEKIKDEKIKLQSRKEALLTLLEQKEDISRLGNMLDSIEKITKKRNMDTDALNAIKFTKQMNEVSKLKEVLDARIKYNKDNTFDINNVNLNIFRNPTEEELQLNNMATVEVNNDTNTSAISVTDEFIDITPKLPIDEEMNMHMQS